MNRHKLREVTPAWIDTLLCEWVAWMHGDDSMSELGYPSAANFARGQRNVSGWDDLADSVTNWRGQVAESIIDSMDIPHKLALSSVYLAAVWEPRRWSIEDKFVEAIALFGERAKVRGLI